MPRVGVHIAKMPGVEEGGGRRRGRERGDVSRPPFGPSRGNVWACGAVIGPLK